MSQSTWFLDLVDIDRMRQRLAGMPPPHEAGQHGNWYAVDIPNLLALISSLVDEETPWTEADLVALRSRLRSAHPVSGDQHDA